MYWMMGPLVARPPSNCQLSCKRRQQQEELIALLCLELFLLKYFFAAGYHIKNTVFPL
jgi:hypothetical protein